MSQVQMTLQSLAQLTYPIIQAPMAGVATPALAAAVSNAGGLGSLGIGSSTLEQARTAIAQTQQLTPHPINVNVFCHQSARHDDKRTTAWLHYMAPLFAELGTPAPTTLTELYPPFQQQPALFELLCRAKPAVVSFHFGIPPQDWLDTLHRLGIYTVATATNLAEAQQIAQAGIKAVIAQGIEAGGHRGLFDPHAADPALPTLALVRLLAHHLDIPIIAAGGIMHGTDIHQALQHGASAVQLGTAFLLCPEAHTTPAQRTALTQPHSTVLTAGISGRPARGIGNRLSNHVAHPAAPPPPDYPIAYDLAKRLASCAPAHTADYTATWVGTHGTHLRPHAAATLMAALVHEWQHAQAQESHR